jgi:hypothetical protein
LALAVMAGILATLGLGGTLAGELGARPLLDVVFFWGFVLMVAAIVTDGLTRRPRLVDAALAAAAAAALLLVIVRTGIPAAERTHLVEYGVLAVVVYEALSERAAQRPGRRSPAFVAVAATGVVGVLDECIQALLPSRVFDPVDLGFNVGAAAVAVGAAAGLRRLRGRGRARRDPD